PIAQPYGLRVDGSDLFANAAHIAACDPDTIRALLAERDALNAENERLRKDAERYRWLREHGRYSGKVLVDHADMGRVLRIEKQLDEIIDAEMQRPNDALTGLSG